MAARSGLYLGIHVDMVQIQSYTLEMIPRTISGTLSKLRRQYPVITMTGPRMSGSALPKTREHSSTRTRTEPYSTSFSAFLN